MKGRTTIILTDARGRQERIQETNMVTGALDSLFNGSPYGLASRGCYPYLAQLGLAGTNRDDSLNLAAGGLLLFGNTIEEDEAHIFESFTNPLIGCASNDAYSGDDQKRGSFNVTESGAITNGYRFVWDFATNQANGTIRCVSLSNARAGVNSRASYPQKMDGLNLENVQYVQDCGRVGTVGGGAAQNVHEVIAFDDDYIVAIGSSLSEVYRIKLPFNKVSFDLPSPFINNALNMAYSEAVSLSTSGKVILRDGDHFYLATPSGGSIAWERYDINCAKVSEGTWTVSAAFAPGRYVTAVAGGYAYMLNSASDAFIAFDMANTADATSISIAYTPTRGRAAAVNIGGQIWHCNGIIDGKVNYPVVAGGATTRLPFRRDGVWLVNLDKANDWSNQSYLNASICSDYLATINNLANPVNKTASKTMKVIYELTAN